MNICFYEEHRQEYELLAMLNLYRLTDVNDEVLEELKDWRHRIGIYTTKFLTQNNQYDAFNYFDLEEWAVAFYCFVNYYIIIT